VFSEFLRNLVQTVYFGTAPAYYIHYVVISCNEHHQATAGNFGGGGGGGGGMGGWENEVSELCVRSK
jgi:hypothetical protein